MHLSPNFDLMEMVVSQEAARRGIPNIPKQSQIDNLQRLCNAILEPLRTKVARPIVVTSGFRSTAVNSLVGGSKTSDHCDGRAADILVPGLTPKQVCQTIIDLNLPFRQVIQEFGQWTHVSIEIDSEAPRREVLTASKYQGKTLYTKGLT